MVIIGRITADAKFNETKSGRKVVHFSIAINDRYQSKEQKQTKEITTYVNCSFWLGSAIAQYLSKGRLVELDGRIGVTAWTDKQGEPKASLTFHVNQIKIHSGKEKPMRSTRDGGEKIVSASESSDDLPF
jgi:single-strand DNA-binding protein